jgi:tetratricopeptide (TPR) repeat protein
MISNRETTDFPCRAKENRRQYVAMYRIRITLPGPANLAKKSVRNELPPMRKPLQMGLLACAAVALLAALWVGRHGGHGARRECELDDTGNTIVTGDGASAHASRYREAAELIGQGRVAEAERLYLELTNSEPDSPNGYVGLGACCLERKDPAGARKQYETALKLAPRSVNALVGLGSSYSFEADYKNATRNYELALAEDERSPEAHWGLAVAYAEMGRRKDAADHLQRFKELAPDSRHIAALEEIVADAMGRESED